MARETLPIFVLFQLYFLTFPPMSVKRIFLVDSLKISH